MVITSDDLLDMGESEFFRLRHDAERGIQAGNHRYGCGLCSGAVKVCAEGSDFFGPYFKHVRPAPQCRWFQGGEPTREEVLGGMYHGTAESDRHRELKLRLAGLLKRQYGDDVVHTEQRVTAHEPESGWSWRRPDILLKGAVGGKPRTIAVELQISNTFLSVIMARQEFYRRHGIHLVWVFDRYPGDLAKLYAAQKDIFYLNNANAFVFDKEVDVASEQEGTLLLRCHTRKCSPELALMYEVSEVLSLEDLTYDDSRMYAFRVDGEAVEREYTKSQQRAIRRRDIHELLDSLKARCSDRTAVSQTFREFEAELQRLLGLEEALNGYQKGVLKTVASLSQGRVIGWNVSNMVQMLYTHFMTIGDCHHPKYEPHRLLIVSAMKVWFQTQTEEHEKAKAGKLMSGHYEGKKTIVQLVREFWRESNPPQPSPSDLRFYKAMRPLYPKLFQQYDAFLTRKSDRMEGCATGARAATPNV